MWAKGRHIAVCLPVSKGWNKGIIVNVRIYPRRLIVVRQEKAEIGGIGSTSNFWVFNLGDFHNAQ